MSSRWKRGIWAAASNRVNAVLRDIKYAVPDK
jgi:hypothetical protein